jgi:hypothetical protein
MMPTMKLTDDGDSRLMPRLMPQRVNTRAASEIELHLAKFHASHPGADGAATGAVEAGWYLAADDLERSHVCCQDLPTALGSAWHAAMHRREGDFSNSLYWWRRAGKLAWAEGKDGVAAQINAALPAGEIRDAFDRSNYDPAVLVRLAERFGDDAPQSAALVIVQRLEWRWLMRLSGVIV